MTGLRFDGKSHFPPQMDFYPPAIYPRKTKILFIRLPATILP